MALQALCGDLIRFQMFLTLWGGCGERSDRGSSWLEMNSSPAYSLASDGGRVSFGQCDRKSTVRLLKEKDRVE